MAEAQQGPIIQPVRLPAELEHHDGLGLAGLLQQRGVPVEFVQTSNEGDSHG